MIRIFALWVAWLAVTSHFLGYVVSMPTALAWCLASLHAVVTAGVGFIAYKVFH